MLTAQTRIAYAQVDNFLNLLDEKHVEMVPRNLRYFFKQEKDINYNIPIIPDIPIKNQNLSSEALALIAYLNLNYWCQDVDEKEKLKKIYKDNDEKYNSEMKRNQHGADDLFVENNDGYEDYVVEEPEDDLVSYKKEGFFRRILSRLKSKFFK